MENKKLEIAKKVIKDIIHLAGCGIYNTRNLVGDAMYTIYEKDGLVIDICYYYSYFEVFGLSDEEFEELEKYYNKLNESRKSA